MESKASRKMSSKLPARQRRQKPGPAEDRLKIAGDWRDAIRRAVTRKSPRGGWPKPVPKK